MALPGVLPMAPDRVARRGRGPKNERGYLLSLDMAAGRVTDQRGGVVAGAEPLSAYVLTILKNGVIKPLIRR